MDFLTTWQQRNRREIDELFSRLRSPRHAGLGAAVKPKPAPDPEALEQSVQDMRRELKLLRSELGGRAKARNAAGLHQLKSDFRSLREAFRAAAALSGAKPGAPPAPAPKPEHDAVREELQAFRDAFRALLESQSQKPEQNSELQAIREELRALASPKLTPPASSPEPLRELAHRIELENERLRAELARATERRDAPPSPSPAPELESLRRELKDLREELRALAEASRRGEIVSAAQAIALPQLSAIQEDLGRLKAGADATKLDADNKALREELGQTRQRLEKLEEEARRKPEPPPPAPAPAPAEPPLQQPSVYAHAPSLRGADEFSLMKAFCSGSLPN